MSLSQYISWGLFLSLPLPQSLARMRRYGDMDSASSLILIFLFLVGV